jgi:hypothetical protein
MSEKNYNRSIRICLSLLLCLLGFVLLSIVLPEAPVTAQQTPTTKQQSGFVYELAEGETVNGTVNITNRCKAPHNFRIREEIKYLSFQESTESILIAPGPPKPLNVKFDATGLKPKVYKDELIVECLNCKKEKGCIQDKDKIPVQLTVKPKPPVDGSSGSIMGRVVDPKNNPIRGAEVRTPGQPVVLTNAKGEFDIRGVAATERLAVSFSAPGFMDTTRIYKVGESSRGINTIVVWPRAEQVSLDATRGGKLTFPGGTVNFPPNALVDERDRPLEGKVKVSFSVLDVSDRGQIRSVPGDFTARMRNKTIRQLETFGVFEVFVEDSNGRRVNLAKGRKAAVELFIPQAQRRTAPKVVGLFSFDQNSGRWIEEGTLRRTPRLVSFTGTINNTRPVWNADMTLNTTCIKLQIVDEDNQPVQQAGIRVEAEGVEYYGLSPKGYTLSDGTVCLSVKKCVATVGDTTVRVTAFDPSNSKINSCPVRISTPCHVASADDCSDPSRCPLQPNKISLPVGTLYHDLNADDPTKWHEADGWTNYDATATNPLSPYNVWWLDDNVIFLGDGIMRLRLENTLTPTGENVDYTSGEYRTNVAYGYGTYEACLKPAKGSGLMTSFFTYTGPKEGTQHNEIDIEFRGQDTTELWTNFYCDDADQGHEESVPLGFDAAEDFHRYKFVWSPSDVKWYVDGEYKPTTNAPTPPPMVPPNTCTSPTVLGKIMVNLWSGRPTATWLYLNAQYTPQNTPIYAEYDWIRYKP